MAQISNTVRGFVQSRLLDTVTGFNFWIQEVASSYTNSPPFVIQKTPPTNLYIGDYTPAQIDEAGYGALYPLVIIHSLRAGNTPPLFTPSEFAGAVFTVVDFWAGFGTDKIPGDGESIGEMIQDAMFETFNRNDYVGFPTQYDPDLTYNNQMECDFGPMQFGGDNWRKLIRFTIQHRYLTQGR